MFQLDATSFEVLASYYATTCQGGVMPLGVGGQVVSTAYVPPTGAVDSTFSRAGFAILPHHLVAGREWSHAHLPIGTASRRGLSLCPSGDGPPPNGGVPVDPGQMAITGYPMQTYLTALRRYRELRPRQRVAAAIRLAFERGAIETNDTRQLGMSPFGWHLPEFQFLRNHPQSLFYQSDRPMEIACYGAGLHSDLDLLEGRYAFHGWDSRRVSRPLAAAQKRLYGDRMATSYEPRELLALFLGGAREGGIHVFDNHPDIPGDLRSPSFTFLDAMRAYYDSPIMDMGLVDRYWWNDVAAGRDVVIAEHGYGTTAYPITSYTFRFTPEEMAKIHVHAKDIVADALDSPVQYDLSVWFEGWYFFPEPLIHIVWAKIIDNAKVGGYIITDLTPIPAEQQRAMGIHLEGTLDGRLYRGGYTRRYLYKKVAEVPGIRELARLPIG